MYYFQITYFLYWVILYHTFVVYGDDVQGNLVKQKALCGQCECLNAQPYHVDCETLDFTKLPELHHDLKVPWNLHLDGNRIKFITKFPKFDNLTSISIKYNFFEKIEDSAFGNLTNLTSLDLSYNNLTTSQITRDIFKGPYSFEFPDPIPLVFLDLSHNNFHTLKHDVFQHLIHLRHLSLSHNPFMDLSLNTARAFTDLIALEVLDLSNTQLMRLPDHFFAELVTLRDLDLSSNKFTTVPAEVNFARGLQTLKLDRNLIKILHPGLFTTSLSSLHHLHLSDMRSLEYVSERVFSNLTNLRSLYMNNNPSLQTVHKDAFRGIDVDGFHLKEVYLNSNGLNSLSEDALSWSQLQTLDLQNNPWNCDCHFEWIVKNILPNLALSDPQRTLSLNCAEPSSLQGHRITETIVIQHDFKCPTAPDSTKSTTTAYNLVVVSTIIMGTLLLVTGTVLFAYILFRRAKVREWLGENVRYRRARNDDDFVASTVQSY